MLVYRSFLLLLLFVIIAGASELGADFYPTPENERHNEREKRLKVHTTGAGVDPE